MIDAERVKRGLECCSQQRGGPELCEQCPYFNEPFPCSNTLLHDALALIEEQEKKAKWIPITSRPMTEEEREEWSENLGYTLKDEEAIIFTSPLPEDGEEVLVCDEWGNVRTDTFCDEGDGAYFEYNGDMEGIAAWMAFPKPYTPSGEINDGRTE